MSCIKYGMNLYNVDNNIFYWVKSVIGYIMRLLLFLRVFCCFRSFLLKFGNLVVFIEGLVDLFKELLIFLSFLLMRY